MKDLITHEEAREAHSKWFDSEQGTKEWDIYHKIVGGYLAQPPVNPDAEVLRDIHSLLQRLNGGVPRFVYTDGDGLYGLCYDVRVDCVQSRELSELRDELRLRVADIDSPLETERK